MAWYKLTLWLLEMNNSVVILEHVDLVDILELLHAYKTLKRIGKYPLSQIVSGFTYRTF